MAVQNFHMPFCLNNAHIISASRSSLTSKQVL